MTSWVQPREVVLERTIPADAALLNRVPTTIASPRIRNRWAGNLLRTINSDAFFRASATSPLAPRQADSNGASVFYLYPEVASDRADSGLPANSGGVDSARIFPPTRLPPAAWRQGTWHGAYKPIRRGPPHALPVDKFTGEPGSHRAGLGWSNSEVRGRVRPRPEPWSRRPCRHLGTISARCVPVGVQPRLCPIPFTRGEPVETTSSSR